jgi:hypothetical protein
VVDALVSRPVLLQPGDFDDRAPPGRTFSALHLSLPTAFTAQIYYFRDERARATYARATAPETRHTAGVRAAAAAGDWSFDVEGGPQWGTFGPSPVRAWLAMSEVAYRRNDWVARPRLALRANRSSGDGGGTRSIGTLSPLFPNGFVFSVPVGPGNLTNLHPLLALTPHPRVTAILDYDLFWRTRLTDGVYDAAGTLLVGTTRSSRVPAAASGRSTSDARFLGQQPLLIVRVAAPRDIDGELIVGRFYAGPALRDLLAARDVTLLQLTTRVRW